MNERYSNSNLSPVVHPHCHGKSISWTAVIVGALVAIGVSFLLNVFALAIGLTAYPTTKDGVTAFAVGGFIGMLIVAFVSMFVGGLVAGHLGRAHYFRRNIGELYGFAAWCLALVISIILAASMSDFVNRFVNINPVTHVTQNANVQLGTNDRTYDAMPADSDNAAANNTPTERTANRLAGMGYVTFILFFVGALAACLGGRLGMAWECEDEVGVDERHHHHHQ